MKPLVVYTCAFGNTDLLQEPYNKMSTRMVCFTDLPIKSRHWEIVKVNRQNTPTRASREYKFKSHILFPGCDTLWLDASFILRTEPKTLRDIYKKDFYRFIHEDRRRIEEEAHAIADLRKAIPQTVYNQLRTYQLEGFDTDSNPMQELSCNGVIFRRDTPENIELNELMLKQLAIHTLRDQMALDYCAWRLGIQLHAWPGSHRDNPHFKYVHFKRPTNDY